MHKESMKISSDIPIENPKDDKLGYAPFAKNLAESLQKNDIPDGIVVGIYGKWGTGKSTLLSFIETNLNEITKENEIIIIRFNPWWYSGENALLNAFFSQLYSKFRTWKKVGRSLSKNILSLSEILAKLPSPEIKIANAFFKRIFNTNLDKLKKEIEDLLKKEKKKIYVFIDDIDRLVSEEIRQLFMLIKSVADFPYTTYILAFDKDVVSKSLSETLKVDGYSYIEKIVQMPFELPKPEETSIYDMLFERINYIFKDIPKNEVDTVYFGNLFHDGIKYYINTPRDVVRITNSISISYNSVRGEVNYCDFIAIECLRVFEPKIYDFIKENPDIFSGTMRDGFTGDWEKKTFSKSLDSLIDLFSEDKRERLKTFLKRIFPKLESFWGNTHYGYDWLSNWRKAKRICSPDLFSIYFTLSIPSFAISSNEFDFLNREFSESELLERITHLSKIHLPNGKTKLSKFLDRLLDYIDDLDYLKQKTIINFIFNYADNFLFKEDSHQYFSDDFGNDVRFGRIFFRTMRKIEKSERFDALKNSFERGSSINTIFRETITLGQQHGKYEAKKDPNKDCVVSLAEQEELEKIALNRLRQIVDEGKFVLNSDSIYLINKWNLWSNNNEGTNWLEKYIESDDNLLLLLKSLRWESFSQSFDDRVGRKHIDFNCEWLAKILYLEKIKVRVTTIDLDKLEEEDKEIIELFTKKCIKKIKDDDED